MYNDSAAAASLAIFPGDFVLSKNEEANVNISLSNSVPSVELLEEQVVAMGPCRNVGQPEEAPVVVGYADDEDEEDEAEDADDFDDDEDEEDENDEDLDDEGLGYDWEEVDDDDEEEDEEDEGEDEE